MVGNKHTWASTCFAGLLVVGAWAGIEFAVAQPTTTTHALAWGFTGLALALLGRR